MKMSKKNMSMYRLAILLLMVGLMTTYSVAATASIWTTDIEGTSKTDFAPGDTVYISGSGFDAASADYPVHISITRPDGAIHLCTDSTWCPEPLPTTPEFSLYPYKLDGIEGTYTIDATDGSNPAQTTFTDSRTITGATLDGASSVTVAPSASITAAVTVRIWLATWRSTAYKIEGGSWQCVNTADHSALYQSYTESFQITAPSSAGTYDVSFKVYSDNSCNNGESNTYTLTDGITVQSVTCTDADGDHYFTQSSGCSGQPGFLGHNDCNDANAAIHPGAVEITGDGVDQNCDGQEICYVDADNDGYRLTSTIVSSDSDCSDSGEALSSDPVGDCNDANAAIYPGATELCNGVDDDCDTLIDEGFNVGAACDGADSDLCKEGTYYCSAGAAVCSDVTESTVEVCTGGQDEDCDTYTDCADSDCQPCVTIVADKVVCDAESKLPNWGGGSSAITSSTASNYVNSHPGCALTSDWNFQYAFGASNPGDNVEHASSPWVTFGPTDGSGRTSVVINKADSSLWFREELKSGYVQFTGASSTDDVTAEFYCNGDVLNYDNYDNLDGETIDNGDTFYCVGFNALIQSCGNGVVEGTEQCDLGAQNGQSTSCCDANCHFVAAQTVCRTASDICDVAETCTGSSATCPADGVQPNTYVCRTSAGVCDLVDYCDGSTKVCPADAKAPLSTPCEADQLFCTVDHCDGNGACVNWKPYDCSLNNLAEIATCYNNPDGTSLTFDYAAAFTSQCDEANDICTSGTQTVTSTCADGTTLDNGPAIPIGDGIRACFAECDGTGTECQANMRGDTCNYGGTCNTNPTACACNYASSQYCPVPGTVDAQNICYYGSRTCTENGCGISHAEMGCKNYCDPVNGPTDTTGPVTSNVLVLPYYNNGNFGLTGTATDTCSNIERAEYFLGHSSIGSCGTPGTGTAMDATDGNFDELIEDLKKDNVNYVQDGLNFACVQSKDVSGNWGNCACYYFESDVIPPDYPTQIKLDDVLNPKEYLVCGNNPVLSAHVCDQQSDIQGGEYFIDTAIPPVPAPWSGYWMTSSNPYIDERSYHCAEISATMNTAPLADGTHYIRLRGKDTVENWGKISQQTDISFIKDTMAPVTEKEILPYENAKVECYGTEASEADVAAKGALTNGCYYVKQGTTITLSATDPDPQGTNEHADSVVIHYIVWYKLNPGDSWIIDQQGQSAVNQPIPIILSKDSYHLIEYWAVDACRWEETHHFELDIVDTAAPSLVKTIVGPSYGACLPQSPTDVCFIDGVTNIHVVSVDPAPHPVNGVKCDWDYTVTDGTKTGTGQTNVVPPFDINFPEESTHVLTITCRDALGNSVTDVETFQVDKTPPTTTKTYGIPRYPDDPLYAKWITSTAPITLTVDDTGVHKSGIKETKYRVTLLGSNEPCESDSLCQQQTGESGSWNTYSAPFTITDESCHLIEYYSVDNVEKTEQIKKQCVYVDNSKPQIIKTVDTPKHECTTSEKAQYGDPDFGCWYITQSTKITLDCDDVMPHPVDDVTLYYRDYLLGTSAPAYTPVQGGYVEIQKTEDSEHVLEFYCVDALGNSQGTELAPHREIDIVDTQAPVSSKTLGDPKHECTQAEQDLYYAGMPAQTDGCYFITQQTPITLTCSDGDPHPVDHVSIKYKDWIVGETEPDWTVVNDDHVTIYKTQDSAHILEWYCVDQLGNTEATHTEFDIVDTQAPVTTKEILGPQYTNQTNGNFYVDGVTEVKLTCVDPTPHPVDHAVIYYRYRVDDGSWPTTFTQYTGQFKFPEESKHELEYYCVDALGNEEVHQFEIDYVDHTPPVTTKTYGTPFYTDGTREWITSQTPITLTATDGDSAHASGVAVTYWRNTLVDERYCSGEWNCQDAVGSGDFKVYEKPFYKPEESCHLIEYYSVDNVEKTETVKKQCVYVENTAPVSSKTLGTPKHECTADEKTANGIDDCWYVTQNTDVTLTCSDVAPHPVDQVAIKYKIDWKQDSGDSWTEGSWVEDGSEVIFKYDKDSYHKLTWYCVDALGNTETQHVELDIVDTQPPVSQKAFDGINIPCSQLNCADAPDCDNYITQTTQIILTCQDEQPHPVDHQKIYYRYFVDGVLHDDWTLYTSPIQYDEDSKHELEWYCVDELGNTEATHYQTERVDSTPPKTTKVVGQPQWDGGYWVTSSTPITLTTVDEEIPCASGPATLYYEVWWDSNCDGTVDTTVQSGSVNTDVSCQLSKTLYLNEECLHEIRWYAVDALGNVEQTHVQQHKVDNTPPHVLILKPVDGWYSEGEDIPIVAIAQDLDNPRGPCEGDCGGLGEKCAVGIENGSQCHAYLLDVLPYPQIVELETEGTFLYNAEAHECQGYATIPVDSEIPDGVVILVVRASDNLGNEAGSLAEILRSVLATCGCDTYDLCMPKCVDDAMSDIVTIWNLPKIGIDNTAPVVTITEPAENTLFGGETVEFSADIIDANDGEVTSTITSGTPCYVTLGGISLGTVPYNNANRKCSGTIMIPDDVDFPQGTQSLTVEIADNAGNLGSDSVSVNVDTTKPVLEIIIPSQNQFVKDTIKVTAQVSDANLDVSQIKISTDNGQTWQNTWYCNPSTYCYDWDTTTATDGLAYGIIAKATDLADNTGYSEAVLVIVDNGAPEGVYVVNPVSNAITQDIITLKVLATDYISGVQSVKIFVQSPAPGFNCDAALIGGTWQCTFNTATTPDGSHIAYAEATDSMGHITTSAMVPFVIDNNAPSMPSIYVNDPDGDGYDTDGDVTWQWSASDDSGSGVDYYILQINNVPPHETKVLGTMFTIADLIDGTHTAMVKAVDKAGHESAWSLPATITVDTVMPQIIAVSILDNVIKSYEPLNVKVITDSSAVSVSADGFGLVGGPTVWTIGASYPQAPDTEGTYSVSIKVCDIAGNCVNDESAAYTVDNTPPSIPALIAPINGALTNDQTPQFVWGSATDTNGIQDYEIVINSVPTIDQIVTTTSYTPSIDLTEETHTWQVRARDTAGNYGSWSQLYTFTVDITPPELTNVGPSGLQNSKTVQLTVTTSEDATCKFSKNDIGYDDMANEMDYLGAGNHQANLVVGEDGLYAHYFKCRDVAGNVNPGVVSSSFEVDTTAPSAVTIDGTEIEHKPYDSNGKYTIIWSGGSDIHFDRFELYEDDVLIETEYTPGPGSQERSSMPEGNHRYQVIAYDTAGHSTASSFFDVFVDTQKPDIEITGTSEFLGMWTLTYTVTDPEPSSSIDKVQVTNSDTPFVACFDDGWCMVIGGSSVELTAFDKAGNFGKDSTEGASADTTPPMLTMTSPSGIIYYNEVTLAASTNELARCYYGTADDLSTMVLMDNNAEVAHYGTQHSALLGTLVDGEHVYHIQCEDVAGNWLDSSKTIVFFIHTEGQYCVHEDLNAGWNTFFLPKLILEDINFQCGDEPYEPEEVLASLYSEPNYDIVWYYNGTNWLHYEPDVPSWVNTLTEFNDKISNPYYIKMNQPDRLELACRTDCPEWPHESCYGTPAPGACGAYSEEQCNAIPECSWNACHENEFCYGTPVSCEAVAANWPTDPQGKCEETSGCYWGMPPV